MPAEPLSDRSGRGDTNSSYACLVSAEQFLTVSSATERSLGWLILLGKSLFTGRVNVQGVVVFSRYFSGRSLAIHRLSRLPLSKPLPFCSARKS